MQSAISCSTKATSLEYATRRFIAGESNKRIPWTAILTCESLMFHRCTQMCVIKRFTISIRRLHFDVSIDPSTPSPFPCSYTPSNPYCDSPNAPSSPSDLSNLDGGFYGAHGQHLSSSGSNAGSLSGLPQQPRQKGRPRKRKPKDIEAMTANLGEFCKCVHSKLILSLAERIQNMSVI